LRFYIKKIEALVKELEAEVTFQPFLRFYIYVYSIDRPDDVMKFQPFLRFYTARKLAQTRWYSSTACFNPS